MHCLEREPRTTLGQYISFKRADYEGAICCYGECVTNGRSGMTRSGPTIPTLQNPSFSPFLTILCLFTGPSALKRQWMETSKVSPYRLMEGGGVKGE